MSDELPELTIEFDRTERYPVARPRGALDFLSAPHFRESLREFLAATPPVVVLDLSALTHLDSAGIGTLVALQRQLQRSNTRLVLAALSIRVRGVLEISRLDGYFTTCGSISEAQRL